MPFDGHEVIGMRNRWILLSALALALALVTGSVQAVSQYRAEPLDHQNVGVIDTHTTIRTGFVVIGGWGPSDSMHVDARGVITATLSVTVTGGPVAFRLFLEDIDHGWATRRMRPWSATFDPGTGTTSGSFTFVAGVAPGPYTVNVMWRSPTGVPVTLKTGTLVVQYGEA
jgi:hypothetical protein